MLIRNHSDWIKGLTNRPGLRKSRIVIIIRLKLIVKGILTETELTETTLTQQLMSTSNIAIREAIAFADAWLVEAIVTFKSSQEALNQESLNIRYSKDRHKPKSQAQFSRYSKSTLNTEHWIEYKQENRTLKQTLLQSSTESKLKDEPTV